MVDNVNTTALSPASLSVDLSSELSCKELCKAVSQCQAMTYGNSRCDLHTSDDTTTASAAGFVHATKQCPGKLPGSTIVQSKPQTGTLSEYFIALLSQVHTTKELFPI